ncbi:unnamed protein product, partial [Musa hybrid cultivar]
DTQVLHLAVAELDGDSFVAGFAYYEEDGERAILVGRRRKTNGACRFLRGCLRCKRFLTAWRPVNGSRSSLVKKTLIQLVMYRTCLGNNDSTSIRSVALGMAPKSSISQTRNADWGQVTP